MEDPQESQDGVMCERGGGHDQGEQTGELAGETEALRSLRDVLDDFVGVICLPMVVVHSGISVDAFPIRVICLRFRAQPKKIPRRLR